MSNLVKMSLEAKSLINEIVANGGEITEELESQLTVNEASLATKLDSYQHVFKTIKSEVEYWEKQKKELDVICKSLKNLEKSLKGNIKIAMENLGTKKLEGNDFQVTHYESGQSLVISDESKIPAQFTIVETKIDSAEIKEALKNGDSVPGAELKVSTGLRFSRKKNV